MTTTSKYPQLVMIIRHGEKPGDPNDDKSGDKHLSLMGSARAAALPYLFTPNPATTPVAGLLQQSCSMKATGQAQVSVSYEAAGVPAGSPLYPAPKFLFATQKSKNSERPLETITPLGQALGLMPETPFVDDDFQSQANLILQNPAKYANQVILICWHHGKAPNLARALGVPASEVKKWDPWNPAVFDLVFMITWKNDQAQLAVDYQGLLFGDTKAQAATAR